MRPSAIRAGAVAAVLTAGCGGAGPGAAPPAPARCPAGPAIVSSQVEVDALAACAVVRGLTIRTGAALDLTHLGQLRQVEGDLVIGPSVGLTEVTLPALEAVDGEVRAVGNGSLAVLALPRLARAHSVVVESNVELRVLAIPALAAVPGDLRVARAASLAMIDATALATVGGRLSIDDAPGLSVIEAPVLTQVGGIELGRTDLATDRVGELQALAR